MCSLHRFLSRDDTIKPDTKMPWDNSSKNRGDGIPRFVGKGEEVRAVRVSQKAAFEIAM